MSFIREANDIHLLPFPFLVLYPVLYMTLKFVLLNQQTDDLSIQGLVKIILSVMEIRDIPFMIYTQSKIA